VNAVLAAFAAALRDLRAPRVLAIVLIPPLAALAAWGVLAWAFADDWARWVADWIATSPWLTWIGNLGLSSVFVWASGIAAVALALPVVLVTAVLVAEIVAMPLVVPWVGERRFPRLERRKGGTVLGSAWNAVATVVVFAVLWVVTLPLWLTGIGALVLPPLLSAFLNQRLFRYDALAEHASPAEYRALVGRAGGRFFLLGLLLAFCYYVPLFNLAAPVLSALAFTHLCLAELAALRGPRP
jgi:uncharacterized protein involved in cysteine biosynthesis